VTLEHEWQSCLHVIVINFIGLPEPDQDVLHLSRYHRPVPNSAILHKNFEILQLDTKFSVLRKMWSLIISSMPHYSWIHVLTSQSKMSTDVKKNLQLYNWKTYEKWN